MKEFWKNPAYLTNLLFGLQSPVGLQASLGHNFRGAVFGRDSLRVAEDVLPWYPALTEQIIMSLAHFQGTRNDPETEEERGKIHHEYRGYHLGYERVTDAQINRLERLKTNWDIHRRPEEVCYWGSIDATPQFVRLVCRFVELYGKDILDRELKTWEGDHTYIGECLEAAANWVLEKVMASPINLLEFQSRNPKALRWHVMRDGTLSYVHPDGTLANFHDPIAPIEVQALAYDALMAYWRQSNDEQYRLAAEVLQKFFLQLFWDEEFGSFVQALDRYEHHCVRKVRVQSSAQAELLDSEILEGEKYQSFVESIIRLMFSSEFLTEAGIRSRGRSHAEMFNGLWDYHGSNVSWAVVNNVFARGLRRHGYQRLAHDIERSIQRIAIAYASPVEFTFVNNKGRVVVVKQLGEEANAVIGTNMPENIQAWTVSALLRIALQQREDKQPSTIGFQLKIVQDKASWEDNWSTGAAPRRSLNRERGKALEREILARSS